MMGCNEIKRLIDEADRADRLPFDAEKHVADCAGCRSFAGERAGLRSLLASASRVSVPANFDAVLRARLEERTSRRALGWLSPANMFKLGAATAGLAAAIFAAQNLNLLAPADQTVAPAPSASQIAEAVRPTAPTASRAAAPGRDIQRVEPTPNREGFVRPARAQARTTRAAIATATAGRVVPAMVTPSIVIVRDQNGERELPVLPVSVGAQSAMYANPSRSMTRTVAVSF